MKTKLDRTCAFCGFHDYRHRRVDAVDERVSAGEAKDEVLADYGFTRETFDQLKVTVYGTGEKP